MEDEKRRKKNKKKKNKQTKAVENNAGVGVEESDSSNQNHAADTRRGDDVEVAEARNDDATRVDDDPNIHVTAVVEALSLAENEQQCRITEAALEEKIKQLQEDKKAYMQKEAILVEKVKHLMNEKDASVLKESKYEERIKQVENENKACMHKQLSFEEKVDQLQKEISSLMQQEASKEEHIKQLQMEKDVFLQKEAGFEMKIFQLQGEKDSWLQTKAGFEERVSHLMDGAEKLNLKRVSLEEKVKETEKEKENWIQKEVGFEERISRLVDEVENLNSMRVSLEERVKEMEKERDYWVQKEKSFRDIISTLHGDNALLQAQVNEFEELKATFVQENQLLKDNIPSSQSQVHNLEKNVALPYSPSGSTMNSLENGDLNSELVATRALVDNLVSENAELVEKVNKLHLELDELRGSTVEVSSVVDSDVNTRRSETSHVTDKSALESDMILGAVQGNEVEHAAEPKSGSSDTVQQPGERLQYLGDALVKAERKDHEHAVKIDVVNSSEIESDEIVQIPLDEDEIQPVYSEVANVDQEEEVALTSAPLIGAPFRLISFVARYMSGADLVDKNSATSAR